MKEHIGDVLPPVKFFGGRKVKSGCFIKTEAHLLQNDISKKSKSADDHYIFNDIGQKLKT